VSLVARCLLWVELERAEGGALSLHFGLAPGRMHCAFCWIMSSLENVGLSPGLVLLAAAALVYSVAWYQLLHLIWRCLPCWRRCMPSWAAFLMPVKLHAADGSGYPIFIADAVLELDAINGPVMAKAPSCPLIVLCLNGSAPCCQFDS